MAFVDFLPGLSIDQCEPKGLYWFKKFLQSPKFITLLKNTLSLNLYSLIVGFPIPVIMAILLNQLPSQRYKKFVQTVTYAPFFISTVVLVGMMFVFMSPSTGIINNILKLLGLNTVFFMGDPKLFPSLYVLSGIWQTTGFNSIIFLAALAGVNPELYESATVDGANRFHKIIHIDIPCIMPTIIIMFIMATGNMLNVGFEKVFLMQTDLNRATSDVIATYVYDVGVKQMQYSYSTAINMLTSVVNMILLFIVNKITSKISETSLF